MERRMKEEPRRECATAELLGESPVWREVCSTLLRVAESDLPVLVLGETGSGKELVAREVHRLSTRSTRAFVAHNCGATPDTLIDRVWGSDYVGDTQRSLCRGCPGLSRASTSFFLDRSPKARRRWPGQARP